MPAWPFGCWLFTNGLCKNISGSSEKQQLSQYLSRLPLNAFSDRADITSSGRLSHKLTTLKEKNEFSNVLKTAFSTVYSGGLIVLYIL